MKKILISLSVIVVITFIQFLTYETIASNKLSKLVIENLQTEKDLTSDSILFSSILEVCSNQKDLISIYDLNLKNKGNFKLIKEKLFPRIVLDEGEYGMYCYKISQETFKKMNTDDWLLFNSNLLYKNKARLNITAIKDFNFRITVNTNQSDTNLNSNKKNTFLWILLFWVEI